MRPWMIGFAADMRNHLGLQRRYCSSSSSPSPSLLQRVLLWVLCCGTSPGDPAIDIDGILEDVEKVEKLWEMVEAAVADAEEREIRDKYVRVWLHQLRYLCYDMEDVHDLFEYQLNATKVMESAATSSDTDQGPPPLEDPSFWTDIKERVGNIKQQFEEIARRKEVLGLKEAVVGMRSEETSGAATGSIPSEPVLVGRKEQYKELVQHLLKAEGADSSNNVEVIAILGANGVGKTFLAQHIFQDLDDPDYFDVTGWVSAVSWDFDPVGVTRDVLEAFTGADWGNCTQLHILQKRIRGLMKGKFFLVMDGFRNLQVDGWDRFFAVFAYKAGAGKGSKIVITSCEDSVAVTVRAAHPIVLECLNEDDGWSLLQYHAFANPKAEHPNKELESIGREIVRKCGGLPSAIKQHGQSLRRNGSDDEDAWRRILKCDNLMESAQGNTSNTRVDGAGGSVATMASSRTPTGSIPAEKQLVGRDLEIDKLVKLIKEEGGSSNVEVIAVVGMGGSGKTCLAQHVYQKLKADKHYFDVTGWVFVSEDFDLVRVTRDVLSAFTVGQNNYGDCSQLDKLQQLLMESVKGKKLLLVIDDIWNEDVERWDRFFTPLGNGGVENGSKVLITTREDGVARIAKATHSIKLQGLRKEDGWSLFQQHAFSCHGEEKLHFHEQQMVGMGKDIVRKCGGLPLAIKVLGGSLRNKINVKDWRDVLESNLWDSIQVEGTLGKQILGPLYLSYLRLPPHLKVCFRYCPIFHRGEEIDREKLMSFWMAHNLIRVHNPSMMYRNIANGYINELISRSFLEYTNSRKDRMSTHDLMFDMLQHISGQEFNVMHEKWELLPDARHLRVDEGVSVPAKTISAFKKRTFWEYPNYRFHGTDETMKVCEGNTLRFLSLQKARFRNLDDCLAKSRLLRTLVLRGCKFTRVPDSLFKLYNLRVLDLRSNHYIQVIPNSISNLRNLVFLDVSFTHIKEIPEVVYDFQELEYLDISFTNVKKLSELPESLRGLTKLEKLNLSGCRSLTRLPNGITELSRLQFLDIYKSGIICMPCGISRLKRLQCTLEKCHVGKAEDGHAGIRDLKTLLLAAQLPDLYIYGLENIAREEAEEHYGSILSHNKHIEWLELYWDWDMSSDQPTSSIKESRINGEADDDQLFVLDALRPHINIKRLTIDNYKGSKLPTWMGDVSFVNISNLDFRHCGNCTSASSLGQLPCLQYLDMFDMASLTELLPPPVKCSGCSTISSISFPKLQKLSIKSCQSIASIPLYGFPSLSRFTIRECSNLEKIEFMDPSSIPSYESTSFVEYINIYDCPQLQFSEDTMLPSSLRRLEVSSCTRLENWIKSNIHSKLADVDFVQLDDDILPKYEGDDRLESAQGNTNNASLHKFSRSAAIMASSWTSIRPEMPPLVGRDEEIDELAKLIKEEGGSSNVEVIAIVGMGGIGKTRLAQHVFQKLKANKHFDVTAWVFVSGKFDLVSLTKATLNAFTNQYHENNELNWLQEKLRVSLNQKKLFLVMDDMWNEDLDIWSKFVAPFMHAEVRKGSKILITTRGESVAQLLDAHCVRLRLLSVEDTWWLFQQYAFAMPIEEDEKRHRLVGFRRPIVQRCAGLPLDTKVLGLSLRNKTDELGWINVLRGFQRTKQMRRIG